MKMDTEKLIYLVSTKPILWDTNSQQYHNRALKNLVWQEVAKELCEKVELVKVKWTTLRDCFRRECKRQMLERKSNKPASRQIWLYYNSMIFLKDVLTFTSHDFDSNNSNSNVGHAGGVGGGGCGVNSDNNDDDHISQSESSFIVKVEYEEGDGNNSCDNNLTTTRTNFYERDNETTTNSMGENMEWLKNKRRKLEMNNQEDCEPVPASQKLEERIKQPADENFSDDYHFVISLLPFLKNISEKRKLETRIKIMLEVQNALKNDREDDGNGTTRKD